MSPSVTDIARMCDVSPSTVCRALNEKSDINRETRKRILAACARAGYAKNRGASNLRMGRSNTIACLAPDLANELFVEKLFFLKQEIGTAGYVPRLYSYRDRGEADALLREIVSSRPAGLVAHCRPDAAMKRMIRGNGIPAVFYDANVPGMDSIELDRRAGSYEAVRHMLGLGRRRIVLLGAAAASERGTGYGRALRDAGLPLDAGLVVDAPFGRDLFRYGYEQIARLWPGCRFDGLYAVNDASAIGAIRALAEAGAAVPRDVSVVGFDDIMLGPFVTPSLSTVHQPKEDMARLAVQFLLKRAADPGAKRQHVRLATRLVVRES
ncbi:MAG: LacI family DNA-binding transcriptional regulator [Kiritimatiellae bacterium]|nr:LacI family DNA-binding transcriptional regulator [Kiritimatiellia bacterium]